MSCFSTNNIFYKNDRNNYLLIIVITTFLCTFFIIFPGIAEAKIFDPVNSDKSVEYLSTIFGNKVGNLHLNRQLFITPFLGNIFQIFNGFILTVAVFILSYVSIVSTINTAQEGQVMGKKWSSIWIPLRSIIGLLLLAPVPGSGYSSLQVVVMWIVLNGIGAADHLWNFVLNNLANVTHVTQTEITKVKDNATLNKQSTELAKSLFNSLVCVNLINHQIDISGYTGRIKLSYYFQEPLADGYPMTEPVLLNFGTPLIPGGTTNPENTICGQFKIYASLNEEDLIGSDNVSINLSETKKEEIINLIYKTKITAIQQVIHSLNNVAHQLGNLPIIGPRDSVNIESINRPYHLYKAVKEYKDSLSNITRKNFITDHEEEKISNLVIKQGKDFGWITAGSYYYLLSHKKSKNLLTTATEEVSVETRSIFDYEEETITTKLNQACLVSLIPTINSYKKAFEAKRKIINNLFNPPLGSELLTSDQLTAKKNNEVNLDHKLRISLFPKLIVLLEKTENKKIAKFIEPYLKQFDDLNEVMLKDVQDWVSNKNYDPLISQASFGVELMRLAEDFWIKTINNSFSSEYSAASSEGSVESRGMLLTILAPTLIFAGIIWTIGASFSVYMPMIPYMMFMVTALGWFLLVIEAMVAAPVVALGFIMPSQDELGKITPALGIIANIFLKPMLIIIGLIMAAKLYNAIITMVNMGFKFSFAALHSQTGTTTFAWVVILILYSTFIVTLVNKCYAVVYQLPDKLLRWISINNEQTDASSIKETQQSFEQTTKQGVAPMEGTATAAASKLKNNILAATKKDGSGLLEPRTVTPVPSS